MRLQSKSSKGTMAALVVMAGLVVWFFWDPGERFDSAKWIATAPGSTVYRNKMADDLLRRYRLIGMSREQIDKLLGQPPATSYFRELCDYAYWLGPERGFISIDSEWLCIAFDGEKVERAELVRD